MFFYRKIHSVSGLTLIEIMVVLTIIGVIIAYSAQRLTTPQKKINASTRKIIVLSKQLHNMSRLKKTTYRIAFTLEEDPEEKGFAFWVESASQSILLKTIKQQEEEEQKQKWKSGDNEQESPFQMDESLLKKQFLPEPYFFSAVQTSARPEGYNTAIGYVHFFPHGLIEQAVVKLSDDNRLNWSLIFHPLTGRVDLVKENFDYKDLEQ